MRRKVPPTKATGQALAHRWERGIQRLAFLNRQPYMMLP